MFGEASATWNIAFTPINMIECVVHNSVAKLAE